MISASNAVKLDKNWTWLIVSGVERRTSFLHCRYCSKLTIQRRDVERSEVRTRFAPSPTGILHLGGLRTALYNYLFAKKHNGSFILRVEDTDRARIHDKSMASIWQALKFTGLVPDEGPTDESMQREKGEFGPYIQSQRLNIYRVYADKLLEEQKVYRCFCSSHRLTLIKHAAYQSGQIPKYDRRCRDMSESEVSDRLRRKEPFTLRVRVPDSVDDYEDEVHGSIPGVIEEGDFIIVKSDGYPTYHFANVVDDHLMRISHVLRGAEWLPAAPRHLFLYRQLGFQPPKIHHLPLIANESGRKLSKRDNVTIFVSNFIEKGYSAEVLLNYITLTGGGFKDSANNDLRILTLEEMCEKFDLGSIRHNAAVLNVKKLDHLSRLHLNQKWATPEGQHSIIKELKEHLADNYLDEAMLDDRTLLRMLEPRIRDVKTVKEFVESNETKFLWAWEAPLKTSFMKIHKHHKVIDYAIQEISKCEEPLEKKELERFLHGPDAPFTKSAVSNCIRLCLSIHKSGPRVLDMILMLGKEESLRRLQVSVDTLRRRRDQDDLEAKKIKLEEQM